MKIVLSRKGVDSSSGGFASPILEDGRLISVPIPDNRSNIRYRELQWATPPGQLIKHLSGDKLNGWSRVHLDPDLEQCMLPDRQPFVAAFGQCGAAQSHLASHAIGAGDLFLFFGWFRRVERYQRRFRYVPNAPDLHVIFGWLQIDRVLPVEDIDNDPLYSSLKHHPHCFGDFSGMNTIYTARPDLTFAQGVNGAGYFNAVSADRTLTARGESRSLWHVPSWMNPSGRDSALSYHHDLSRWRKSEALTLLQSVSRGQEFVLDTRHYPEALDWVGELFSAAS